MSVSRPLSPVCFILNRFLVVHTLVMVCQTISLNVAVNSYDHALLTLLMSNQFVEIKGSVFKKFEKDNLFQITCAGMSNAWRPVEHQEKLTRRQTSWRDLPCSRCSSSSRFGISLSLVDPNSTSPEAFRCQRVSGGSGGTTFFGPYLM